MRTNTQTRHDEAVGDCPMGPTVFDEAGDRESNLADDAGGGVEVGKLRPQDSQPH